DLHECGVLPGVAGIDGGKIRRDADVRNDHVQILRRDDLANVFFYVLNVLIGQFKTRAGGGLDIDHELPGISSRKEPQTQQRVERETKQTDAEDSDDRRNGTT